MKLDIHQRRRVTEIEEEVAANPYDAAWELIYLRDGLATLAAFRDKAAEELRQVEREIGTESQALKLLVIPDDNQSKR